VFIGATARKEILVRSGLFDPSILGSEEFDLWIRVLRNNGRIVYHRRVLANYRLSLTQQSNDKFEFFQRSFRMFEKHLHMPDISAAERGWFEDALRKQTARFNLLSGKKALYEGDFAEALDRLTQANGTLSSLKLRLAVLGLRIAPALIQKLVRSRYPTEHAFLH
jgi:hypothetical protein